MFVTTDAMVVFLENWCIREQGFLACSHLLHSLFALTGLWVLDENCCWVWGVPSCGTGDRTEMMLVWQSNAMWILHDTTVEFCILSFEDLYQQYISLFRSLFDLRLQCLEVIPLTLALMKGKKKSLGKQIAPSNS